MKVKAKRDIHTSKGHTPENSIVDLPEAEAKELLKIRRVVAVIEPEPSEDWDDFKNGFIRKGADKFKEFVDQNAEEFAEAPDEIIEAAQKKWTRFFPGEESPFRDVADDEE